MAFVKLADNYTDLIGKFAVALREEGVDRNFSGFGIPAYPVRSPSSRRAWIEISVPQASQMYTPCRPPRRGYG